MRVCLLSAKRRAVAFLKTEKVKRSKARAVARCSVTAFWQLRLLVTSHLIKLPCCSRASARRVRTAHRAVATEIEIRL